VSDDAAPWILIAALVVLIPANVFVMQRNKRQHREREALARKRRRHGAEPSPEAVRSIVRSLRQGKAVEDADEARFLLEEVERYGGPSAPAWKRPSFLVVGALWVVLLVVGLASGEFSLALIALAGIVLMVGLSMLGGRRRRRIDAAVDATRQLHRSTSGV
jgi:hypothetical protein